MERDDNKKEANNHAEASTKSQSSQKNNKEAENPTEASTKVESYDKNHMVVGNLAEASNKAELSKKGTPKSLKAKSKLVKKSSASSTLKAKKANDGPKVWKRNIKNKNKMGLKEGKESRKNELQDSRFNTRTDIVQKNVAIEECIEKGQEGSSGSKKYQQEQSDNCQEEIGGSKKSQQNQRDKCQEGIDGSKKSQQNQRDKGQEGINGSKKSQQNQRNKGKHQGMDRVTENRKDKIKLGGKKTSEHDEKKKEKLGGLIFMCSAKTKPDCFRYRVMGVTSGKKDLVLSVKPGLKLFLYDFDLKLMYGIFEASSSGGMKLEPKAFGGSFPVQVRFNIYKDCFPLPESVFKKAIKDNYDERNKFKIELSVRQVRKLSQLFRPVTLQSAQPALIPIRPPPMATVRDREVYDGLRELRTHSEHEPFARTNGEGSSYSLLPQERDHRIDYQEMVSTRREKNPRDLYMSEQDYRTYGLQGERRNLTPQHHIASTIDPYQRDQGRERLHGQPVQMYSDIVPVRRESVFAVADPLYSSRRELTHNLNQIHDLATAAAPSLTNSASVSAAAGIDRYTRDPYSSRTYHYGTSSGDSYLPSLRREGVSLDSQYVDSRRERYGVAADPLQRIEADHRDKLYSMYTLDALSKYNQVQESYGARQENATPVSSRYSFAGPSMSYR